MHGYMPVQRLRDDIARLVGAMSRAGDGRRSRRPVQTATRRLAGWTLAARGQHFLLDRGASLPEKDTSDPSGSLVVSALTMAEVALAYAARGWRVFPLFPIVDGRCGCGRACGTKPGKHPALKGWTTRATTDEATIRGWWEKWPNAGIGIATGRGSGLVVVDRDGAAGGTLRGEFESEHGALPDTAVAETGREGGGDHSYYRYPKDGPPLKGIRTGKLDILADGNYVVAPPSIHASGKEYAWKPGSTVLAEIAPEIAATLRAWIEAKSKGGEGRGQVQRNGGHQNPGISEEADPRGPTSQ